jgi:hypothetical protein
MRAVAWAFIPTTSELLLIETLTVATAAGVTATVTLLALLGSATDVAVIVADPGCTPLTTPAATVAIAGALEPQVTFCDTPGSASTLTVSVVVSAARTEGDVGVISTLRTFACTVTVADPSMPPDLARIVVVPAATEVTVAEAPDPETVATPPLPDVHTTLALVMGTPSVPSTLAVSDPVT